MSEDKIEKLETPDQSDSKTAKTDKKRKVKGSNRLAKWFREMRSELKKVVWPTPKQILNNTIVALVLMMSSAAVIWALDTVAGEIFIAIVTYIPRLITGW